LGRVERRAWPSSNFDISGKFENMGKM